VIDVAAITTGWSDADRAVLVRAYLGEAAPEADEDEFERDVEAARLHLAARWLGWSATWTPPPEHRQDWLEEARRAGERLAVLG
jgi:hypothetical protein